MSVSPQLSQLHFGQSRRSSSGCKGCDSPILCISWSDHHFCQGTSAGTSSCSRFPGSSCWRKDSAQIKGMLDAASARHKQSTSLWRATRTICSLHATRVFLVPSAMHGLARLHHIFTGTGVCALSPGLRTPTDAADHDHTSISALCASAGANDGRLDRHQTTSKCQV